MEIPEKINCTLYVNMIVAGHRPGEISIYDHDYVSDLEGMEQARLFSFPLEIDVPKNITHEDLTKGLVETLEKKKQSMQAEYHVELKRIQDKIDNLLALPHTKE